MTITFAYQDIAPATRLANTLSSDRDKRALFADYFQDKSSDREYQATQNQIVTILNHSEKKQNAFFTTLNNIFQQESFTEAHYRPIKDIVSALHHAGNDIIHDIVYFLAENSVWGKKLFDFFIFGDEANSFDESPLGSSSNLEASAIEDPQEEPVILRFPQNNAS
jgi:hypothetical protein